MLDLLKRPAVRPEEFYKRLTLNSSSLVAGKKILVTGGGTGVGHGIAMAFAEQGANVACHWYNEEEQMLRGLKQIKAINGKMKAFQADFSNTEAPGKLFKEVLEYFDDEIDILINTAGITANVSIEKEPEDFFDIMLNVNYRSARILGHLAGEKMSTSLNQRIKSEGKEALCSPACIFNFSSQHSLHVFEGHEVYAMTKAAIESLTRSLAAKYAPAVRVNTIAPGGVVVENHFQAFHTDDIEFFEKTAENVPMRRNMSPYEMGRALVTLCSPELRYMTGAVLPIDGGFSLGMPDASISFKPCQLAFGRRYIDGLD